MAATTMKAQYAGTCPLCLAAISRGNRIVMVARKACHEGCVDRATVEQSSTQPTYMDEAQWTAYVAETATIRVRYAALTTAPAAVPERSTRDSQTDAQNAHDDAWRGPR